MGTTTAPFLTDESIATVKIPTGLAAAVLGDAMAKATAELNLNVRSIDVSNLFSSKTACIGASGDTLSLAEVAPPGTRTDVRMLAAVIA